eukprot:8938751-Pyramimonas_sp.AAC.1
MGRCLRLVALDVAKECIKQKVLFSFENPASSTTWGPPPMVELAQSMGLEKVLLDYCRFGANWKKPTIFATKTPGPKALGK